MSTPFEEFYEDVFGPNLDALDTYESGPVFSNGHDIREASWDRKAAFLLFLLVNDMPPPLGEP
jgi:hypothetical protein